MKRILMLLLLFTELISKVNAQPDTEKLIVFEGTADGKFNGEYIHIYNRSLDEKHDSVKIINGKFTFKRFFKEPTRYMFYSSYELKTNHSYKPFGILVGKPGTIYFNATMEGLTGSTTRGSVAQDVFNHFSEDMKPAEKHTWNLLYSKYGKEYVDSAKVDTTTQKYRSLMHDYNGLNEIYMEKLRAEIEGTIRRNPDSYTAIYLLSENIRNFTLSKQEELYALLSPKLKTGKTNAEIVNVIEGTKKSAIGNVVDNFTLSDANGQSVSFSALKGKYILIDFWGSWCAPCHVAFKDLRTLYETYHDKGLEILGIATEHDKNAWKADITKEKLPWKQMIDNEGDKGVSERLFAVTEYPTTVLVDPKGQIIGRNLTISELQKILDHL